MTGPENNWVPPPLGMSIPEFRIRGKELIDFIADYYESIESYRVVPDVAPGYLASLVPDHAPDGPEPWDQIMMDYQRVIMPGMTHWQSPRFHAYFPAGASFPSLLADLLCNSIQAIGFSWIACPAMTELEMIMADWVAIMLGLSDRFRMKSNGGGVINGSASEATLVSALLARQRALAQGHPIESMTAYLTPSRHASYDKAMGLSGITHIRLVKDSIELERAIVADLDKELHPTYIGATLGYTSTAQYDHVSAIGPIALAHSVYLHVDAAYAGTALICPEFRYMIEGIDYADSIVFNPHKWMMVHFDCSLMYVADRYLLQSTMASDMAIYRHHANDSTAAADLRNWQIPLGRRFRALKLWFTIRSYGVAGLQSHIRNQCRLAERFASHLSHDTRFTLYCHHLGLVCFHLKPDKDQPQTSSNQMTLLLLNAVNQDGSMYLVHTVVNDLVLLRFCVCASTTTEVHIDSAWSTISHHLQMILTANKKPQQLAI